MRDQLSAFTTYELLDEVRRRFAELEKTQVVAMQTQLPPPSTPKQIILAGPSPDIPILPKGIVKVEEIPGRFNRDGSPRKLLTAAIPENLKERLTVTPQALHGRDEFDGRTQFIVRGSEREALANSFIQQWKDEVVELENQLAQVNGEDERESIQQNIRRLQDQIALRSDSAFGGITAQEARARNLADNGNLQDAPSEAAVPGRGWQFVMASGLKEWDAPLSVDYPLQEVPSKMVDALVRAVNNDPICGHVEPKIRQNGYMVQLRTEPSVIYRMAYHWEKLCAQERLDPRPLYDVLGYLTKEHHVHFMTDADSYRGAWTSYLKARIGLTHGDEYASYKRAVRILNPDFQEKEAPSSFFESTDGENPLGPQLRPHIDPRSAWDEVEAGPGVFHMSRRTPPVDEEED